MSISINKFAFTMLNTILLIAVLIFSYFFNEYVVVQIAKTEKSIQTANIRILAKSIRKHLLIGDIVSLKSSIKSTFQSKIFEQIRIYNWDNTEVLCQRFDNQICIQKYIDKNVVKSHIYFDFSKKKLLAVVEGHYDKTKIGNVSSNVINVAVVFIIVFFIFINCIVYFLIKVYKKTLNKMLSFVNNTINEERTLSESSFFKEVNLVNKKLRSLAELYHEKIDKIKSNEKKEAYGELAQQVAHDIRSPLTALNVVSKNLLDLPEGSRVLLQASIQRIQDIANNLFSQSGEKLKNQENFGEIDIESSLILPILEEIISEKRYQLRNKVGVNIILDGEKAYGLFAKVNDSSLKRIISNLINNSVEAFDDFGEVVVKVSDNEKNNTEVLLSIKDNGKGIPKDILPKLAQRGVSFGKDNDKESGSGLGLYHARANIERWGGRFSIESEESKGTEIKLYLPKAKAPSWFVPAIHLKGIKNIVVLDDDESIHQVWDRRLRQYIEQYAINLQHARSPEDFKKLTEGQENLLCLCDYELLGFEETGLDLIEKNSLEDVSILVTSKYAEEKVQERCEKLGVKLIPKTSADVVPLNFKKGKGAQFL